MDLLVSSTPVCHCKLSWGFLLQLIRQLWEMEFLQYYSDPDVCLFQLNELLPYCSIVPFILLSQAGIHFWLVFAVPLFG